MAISTDPFIVHAWDKGQCCVFLLQIRTEVHIILHVSQAPFFYFSFVDFLFVPSLLPRCVASIHVYPRSRLSCAVPLTFFLLQQSKPNQALTLLQYSLLFKLKMGNLISTLFSTNSDTRILMLGLDAAGYLLPHVTQLVIDCRQNNHPL